VITYDESSGPRTQFSICIIIKQFRDRHLIVAKPVVAFLARRIERSAKAAAEVVDHLDRASKTQAHGITIPFIRTHMTF